MLCSVPSMFPSALGLHVFCGDMFGDLGSTPETPVQGFRSDRLLFCFPVRYFCQNLLYPYMGFRIIVPASSDAWFRRFPLSVACIPV
jgi:hypothetical protein